MPLSLNPNNLIRLIGERPFRLNVLNIHAIFCGAVDHQSLIFLRAITENAVETSTLESERGNGLVSPAPRAASPREKQLSRALA